MSADVQPTRSRLVQRAVSFRRLHASLASGRRRIREEELELIERLGRLEREARRSGAYMPKLGPGQRWS